MSMSQGGKCCILWCAPAKAQIGEDSGGTVFTEGSAFWLLEAKQELFGGQELGNYVKCNNLWTPIPSRSLSYPQNSCPQVRYLLRIGYAWKCIALKCITNKTHHFSPDYTRPSVTLSIFSPLLSSLARYPCHLLGAHYRSTCFLRSSVSLCLLPVYSLQ